jgi:HEAT repeat protein
MRSIITIVAVLSACLLAVAPLAAQPKAELTPKAAGVTSQTTKINGKTLQEWVKQVKDPDAGLAEVAIHTIALFGTDAGKEKEPSAALIDALSLTDTSLRVNACITLAVIGVHDSQVPKAVTALSKMLRNDQQSIARFYAAIALGRMEDEARPAIADLADKCHDQASWEIRRACAYALGKAGRATRDHPLDKLAANALMASFSGPFPDKCAEVRLTAVMALGGMGIPALPQDKNTIIQNLTRALNDRHKPVVIWAHMGLVADGEPAAKHLPEISKFLKNKDFEAHLQAIRALGIMGKDGRSEAPELLKELDPSNPEPLLIAAAAWALGQMNEDKAVPLLKGLLEKKDLDPSVRNAVQEALEKLEPKTKDKK